jgi:hypothetical protein
MSLYTMRMMQRRTFCFRNVILILAGVLALQAVWLITADFFRPMLPYFPQDKADEEKASASSSAAVRAASIGMVRGDLWRDAAIALSSGLINKLSGGDGPQLTSQRDPAAIARRAARLSPHDSRTWLLLAALDSRFVGPNPKIASYLKMSFFTGANELALVPLRIHIATHSMLINDAELQNLVEQDIRLIVLRHQGLKPALLAAYRDASPDGKKIIETTVGEFDKNFFAINPHSDGRQ